MIGAARVCCSDCLGDGYTIVHMGEWDEGFAACQCCGGSGEIDVEALAPQDEPAELVWARGIGWLS